MLGGKVLSPYEWSLLSKLVIGHSWLLAKQGGEMILLSHLAMRTLPYRKFQERFHPKFLLTGRLQFPTFPCGIDRTWLYRARCSLQDASVVFFERTGNLPTDPLNSIINAPGITNGFLQLASLFIDYDYHAESLVGELGTMKGKLDLHWEKNGWPVAEVSMVKEKQESLIDAVEKGKEKALNARERRKKRRETASLSEMRPGWITEYMKEYCEDVGAAYAELLTTEKERARIRGSAKNFLTYCKKDGVDPKELLYNVCKHWNRFRSGALEREDGTTILLPRSVSFEQFFIYRKHILDWLAIHKDDPIEKCEVVFIKDHRAEGE
jgi:hypothetical protein